MSTVLDIDEPVLPRQQKKPKRFIDDGENAYVFDDPESYYRKLNFGIVDAAITSLESRFNTDGFKKVTALKLSILCAATSCQQLTMQVKELHPELSVTILLLHFQMV